MMEKAEFATRKKIENDSTDDKNTNMWLMHTARNITLKWNEMSGAGAHIYRRIKIYKLSLNRKALFRLF